MRNLSKLSCVVSVVLAGAAYILMFITFMDAYLSDTQSVEITINTIGEARFELILLTIGVPFIFLGFKDYVVKTFEEVRMMPETNLTEKQLEHISELYSSILRSGAYTENAEDAEMVKAIVQTLDIMNIGTSARAFT